MLDVAKFMQQKNNIPFRGKSLPIIGIDLLGSDLSSQQIYEELLCAQKKLSFSAEFLLFSTKEFHPPHSSNIKIVIVDESITMEDHPFTVLKKKKNSSINKGIKLLKEQTIDAFISFGNTGALLTCAITTLHPLEGIQRPALMALMPSKNKQLAVVDVGANIQCKAEHLVQFAKMGIAYQKTRGVAHPIVGLLNIGSEETKGTIEHQQAFSYLKELNTDPNHPTFIGNIEGRDVFKGTIDVLVSDGFSGNVFLKTSEGMAEFIFTQIQSFIKKEHPSFEGMLQEYAKTGDYSEYPGALLCGVKGIVMKCHGSGKSGALLHSIEACIQLHHQNFLQKMSQELT